MRIYKVKVRLKEKILGTQVPEGEMKRLSTTSRRRGKSGEENGESMKTVFYRHNGRPCLRSYQVKGWFKEAFVEFPEMLGLRRYATSQPVRSRIDRWLFVLPDVILFTRDGEIIEAPDGELARPMRAQTRAGERVFITSSEYIEPPAEFSFEVHVLDNCPITEKVLREVLDHGRYLGMLRWRTAGFGTFEVIDFRQE